MKLVALYRYPVKSAAGERLSRSPVGALGLTGDRRWMVVDAASGRFLTQRQLPKMTGLKVQEQADGALRLFAEAAGEVQVAVPEVSAEARGVSVWRDLLQVPDAGDAAAQWLSDWLGRSCRLVHMPLPSQRPVDPDYARPDDRVAFADGFPLLLASQASLADLNVRVGRELDMRRFRPNLVIDGDQAFAEDGWRSLQIGDLVFRVAKPCSRCAIVTLDPDSGERSPDLEPLTTLARFRKQDGQVYFGQNLIADGEGVLEEGMPVKVLD